MFVIPDLLRSGLWGWSWNRTSWPGKLKADDPANKRKLIALQDALLELPGAGHFLNRARFYTSLGEIEKALADYNQVIHEDPEQLKAFAERADLHLLLHNDKEALNDLLVYSNACPDDLLTELKLSYVYLLLGDFPEGQFHLRRFEEKGKPDPNAKLIGQYILNFKRRMHLEIGVADIHLKSEYSEENLRRRAEIKEKAFDLVGASEDYLMLYLLFEREEYQKRAEKIKLEILERHRRQNKM